MQRPAQPAAALRPARQRPGRVLSHAVQPDRHRVADAVRPQRRRAGRPVGARARRTRPRVGKFTHPSGAPDNHLLTVWSPGPVNHQYTVTAAARRRHLPHQGRQADRRAGPDAAHQERSELQRAVAARPGALQAHLRRRRAEAACRRWPTTASCRRTCRKGRRSAWSARRACTSARAIPTASCRTGKVTATFAGGNDPWQGARRVHQPRQRHAAQLAQPGGRRRPLRQRRHPRHPHPGDGADDRPQPRPEGRPAVLQPRQRAAAHPRRDPGAQVRRRASNRSIPTATPTPASWPRSPPTWPSRSRRSTRTAWC